MRIYLLVIAHIRCSTDLSVHEAPIAPAEDAIMLAETEYETKVRAKFGTLVPLLPIPAEPLKPSSTFLRIISNAAHSQMRAWMISQGMADDEHPISAPYAMYDGEILPDGTRIRLSHPWSPISRRPYVVVFEAIYPGRGPVILKYQSNCDYPASPSNDLVRDYRFQVMLKGTGICPSVFFLSPPAKFPNFKTPKLSFELNHGHWIDCARHPRSHVRYMLMEKLSETVWDQVKKAHLIPSLDRFYMGLQLIENLIPKLMKLHTEMRTVHADVHPGNLVVLSDGTYGLFDFGLAFFVDEYGPGQARPNPAKWYAHCYYSHYNIMGYRFSPRDDVYKVLSSAAILMVGMPLFDECKSFEANVDGIHMFHRNMNLFDYRDFIDTIPFVDATNDVTQAIKDHLFMMLHLARSVDDVALVPDYDEILRHASAIRRLSQGGTQSESLSVPEIDLAQPRVQTDGFTLTLGRELMWAFSQSKMIRDLPPGCQLPENLTFLENPGAIFKLTAHTRSGFNSGTRSEGHSTNMKVSVHRVSDFEATALTLFAPFDLVERLSPTNADSCGDSVAYTRSGFGLNSIGGLSSVKIASVARSGVTLLKYVHLFGGLLGNSPYVEFLTLNTGDNKPSLRFRKLPNTFEMYVDPISGRHVSKCAAGWESDGCGSRRMDMENLALFLAETIDEETMPGDLKFALRSFGQEAMELDFFSQPEYAKWEKTFEDLELSLNTAIP